MPDVEQILSELAITNDRVILSKFDSSFLGAPIKMSFKQDYFKSAKCPADLIFQQCVALNKLDQLETMLPDMGLVKLLSYKECLTTLLMKADLQTTDLNFIFEILINIFLANHPNGQAMKGIGANNVEGKKRQFKMLMLMFKNLI